MLGLRLFPQVRPRSSGLDRPDVARVAWEVFGDQVRYFSCKRPASDLPNVCFRQPRKRIAFSNPMRSMTHAIGRILFFGSPREIFQAVVASVAVEVPHFLAIFAQSDECFEHELMHASMNRVASRSTVKRHHFVSTMVFPGPNVPRGLWRRRHPVTWAPASYATVIADIIPRSTFNRHPLYSIHTNQRAMPKGITQDSMRAACQIVNVCRHWWRPLELRGLPFP